MTLARGGADGWAGLWSGHALASRTPTLHASHSPTSDAWCVVPPGELGTRDAEGRGRGLCYELLGGQRAGIAR